jgi:hypothetical protein
MKKILLQPEQLRVEGFATLAAAGSGKGTVAGNEFTVGLNCPETNYISCPHAYTCTHAALA